MEDTPWNLACSRATVAQALMAASKQPVRIKLANNHQGRTLSSLKHNPTSFTSSNPRLYSNLLCALPDYEI